LVRATPSRTSCHLFEGEPELIDRQERALTVARRHEAAAKSERNGAVWAISAPPGLAPRYGREGIEDLRYLAGSEDIFEDLDVVTPI
jgi:hypothetical protein